MIAKNIFFWNVIPMIVFFFGIGANFYSIGKIIVSVEDRKEAWNIQGVKGFNRLRHLVVRTEEGMVLDSIRLFPNIDGSESCDGSLFLQGDTTLLFVDCGGWWYYISKDGKIDRGEWKHGANVENKYLGTFTYNYNKGEYVLKKKALVPNLYPFKDSKDYSGRFGKEVDENLLWKND